MKSIIDFGQRCSGTRYTFEHHVWAWCLWLTTHGKHRNPTVTHHSGSDQKALHPKHPSPSASIIIEVCYKVPLQDSGVPKRTHMQIKLHLVSPRRPRYSDLRFCAYTQTTGVGRRPSSPLGWTSTTQRVIGGLWISPHPHFWYLVLKTLKFNNCWFLSIALLAWNKNKTWYYTANVWKCCHFQRIPIEKWAIYLGWIFHQCIVHSLYKPYACTPR